MMEKEKKKKKKKEDEFREEKTWRHVQVLLSNVYDNATNATSIYGKEKKKRQRKAEVKKRKEKKKNTKKLRNIYDWIAVRENLPEGEIILRR